MSYNILSGNVSTPSDTRVELTGNFSGSFEGDGTNLSNVAHFNQSNSYPARIAYYGATAAPGPLGSQFDLKGDSNFNFDENTDTLTVKTGSFHSIVATGLQAGTATNSSFLALDSLKNVVLTSSSGGGGGITYSRRQITSSATASVSDTLIGVSASAVLEIRLPSAGDYENGQYFIIKDEGGNADQYGIVVRTSGSETIDGELSVTLESPFAALSIYSNGTDKFFIY